jgi:hypothetical protein
MATTVLSIASTLDTLLKSDKVDCNLHSGVLVEHAIRRVEGQLADNGAPVTAGDSSMNSQNANAITHTLSARSSAAHEQVIKSRRRSSVQWILGTSLFAMGLGLLCYLPALNTSGLLSIEMFAILLLRHSRLAERDCKYYLSLKQAADAQLASYQILEQHGSKQSLSKYALERVDFVECIPQTGKQKEVICNAISDKPIPSSVHDIFDLLKESLKNR